MITEYSVVIGLVIFCDCAVHGSEGLCLKFAIWFTELHLVWSRTVFVGACFIQIVLEIRCLGQGSL
jgi:hypothetical protein